MVTHYTVDDLRVALGFGKPDRRRDLRVEQSCPLPTLGRSQAPTVARAGVRSDARRKTPYARRLLMFHSLNQRSRFHLELAKASGVATRTHRPLIWRLLMHRAPWPLIPDRSSGCHLLVFCLLAALAAPGCGHEEKSHYTSVSKPPSVQMIHPQVRTILRVVGQPSFIESFERTSIYPEADRLYREVERGHRRQVEEGRRARHALRARARRGFRHQEGDRQARRGTDRAGPQAGGGGRRRRQGGRGCASSRRRRSWPSSRPRSTAGTPRSSGSRTR